MTLFCAVQQLSSYLGDWLFLWKHSGCNRYTEQIAHLRFLKWSITAAHCCWEWWLAPTMEIWLPTEICSINWSEVAKSKGELLPSTWLLLLLQILPESSFLFSASLKIVCMVCSDCHFWCSTSCCYCWILPQWCFPTPPKIPVASSAMTAVLLLWACTSHSRVLSPVLVQ